VSRSERDERGGRIYVTLCGGGRSLRSSSPTSRDTGRRSPECSCHCRFDVARKNINQKSKTRLVGRLKRQLPKWRNAAVCTTALVLTYLASKTGCPSATPAPLIRFFTGRSISSGVTLRERRATRRRRQLPTGADEHTRLPEFDVKLAKVDLPFFTDELIEDADPDGKLQGESGLLAAVREIDMKIYRRSVGRRYCRQSAGHAVWKG